MVLFFFSSRRRHTRYWRDWSSDVCSSDLDRLADNVEDAPERLRSDRDGDRGADVDDLHPALQPVGAAHRDGAYPVVAEVLLNFEGQGVTVLVGDLDAVVDLGKRFRCELDVDHRAGNLDDGAGGGHG